MYLVTNQSTALKNTTRTKPNQTNPQMIGDEQRGFAWTRALLGLPANEVHVCGDLSAVALVRQLAEECGDEFELRVGVVGGAGRLCVCVLCGWDSGGIGRGGWRGGWGLGLSRRDCGCWHGGVVVDKVCATKRSSELQAVSVVTPHPTPPNRPTQTYDRMTPLAVDETCLPNGWADVQPGDCVVAFSRKQLYFIRKVRRLGWLAGWLVRCPGSCPAAAAGPWRSG